MSRQNESDRRAFVRATVLALAAGRFPMVRSWQQPLQAMGHAAAADELSSLRSATAWINSPALTEASVKGKVVLIQFWTFTCINWLRTLPYVRAWAQSYESSGLVTIGVHTPEFPFEHDLDDVRRATTEMTIRYPVAVDNDYAIWGAFNNQYWPALYLVDTKGRVRHRHFGEGGYAESARMIQQLLKDGGAREPARQPVAVEGRGLEADADWGDLKSSENYVGYARTESFSSPEGAAPEQRRIYTLPRQLRLNQWALDGDWTIENGLITLNQPGGRIAYRFHSRDLHLVMGPPKAARPVRFRALLDGKPPGAAHGGDVDEQGNGVATTRRLYQVIRQPKPIVDRVFSIEYLDQRVEAYSFTFG